MSKSPYVLFYTSDFLGGTGGMTAGVKGVYITLICLIYEAEAPLAQNWDTLARRCGCTLPTFKRALEALSDDGKVTISDAGIWSDKCEPHISRRRERSDSGAAAAKSRWEKDKQKQGAPDANAMQAQCQPEPEPYTVLGDTNVSPVISPASEAVQIYNETAPNAGWPVVQKMTKSRISAINGRLKECGGVEGWRHAIERAAASRFLTGQTSKPFFASFDWITKAGNFTKLMEGNYDNRDSNNAGSPGMADDPFARLVAEAARSR